MSKTKTVNKPGEFTLMGKHSGEIKIDNTSYSGAITVTLCGDRGCSQNFDIDEAEVLHQKLGELIAEVLAKRNDNQRRNRGKIYFPKEKPMSTERQVAEDMIDKAAEMAAEGRRRLDELDELKLRHGDYGTAQGFPHIIMADQGGGLHEAGCAYMCRISAHENDPPLAQSEVLGNIFDDLRRNSEDLEEFKTLGRGCYSDGLRVRYDNDLAISLKLSGNDGRSQLWFALDQIEDIHQKLGQIIATAKRRQSNA